jgi:hypothetical protein
VEDRLLPRLQVYGGDRLLLAVDALRQGTVQDLERFYIEGKKGIANDPGRGIHEILGIGHVPTDKVGHSASGIGQDFTLSPRW